MDITDAVAMGRHVYRRHALHEASGKPAKTAIAERSIRLEPGDHIEIDTERSQRLAHIVEKAEVREGVAHQPADEEFQRQIVDALFLLFVGSFCRLDPALDNAVAHDLDRGCQPVVLGSDRGILAEPVGKALQDFCRQGLGIGFTQNGPQEIGDWRLRHQHFQFEG